MIQTLNWQGPSEWAAPEGRILLVENRTINIYPGEVNNQIDIRSQLRPTDWDIHIGPTRHAYFGVRIAEALRATSGGRLTDSAGRSSSEVISGECADWVDCSGTVAANRQAGVALFSYPSDACKTWYVSDWGILALNPFAKKQVAIKRNEVLDLAVRVVVHDGDAEEADVNACYRSFVESDDRSGQGNV